MIAWVGLFALMTVIAGALGFGGAPSFETILAQIVFFVSGVGFLVSFALASTQPAANARDP